MPLRTNHVIPATSAGISWEDAQVRETPAFRRGDKTQAPGCSN